MPSARLAQGLRASCTSVIPSIPNASLKFSVYMRTYQLGSYGRTIDTGLPFYFIFILHLALHTLLSLCGRLPYLLLQEGLSGPCPSSTVHWIVALHCWAWYEKKIQIVTPTRLERTCQPSDGIEDIHYATGATVGPCSCSRRFQLFFNHLCRSFQAPQEPTEWMLSS